MDGTQANRAPWVELAPDVERFLGELPLELSAPATLLRMELGCPSTTRGLLDHFLADDGDHPPLLAYAAWLLDDLGLPAGPERLAIERTLFFAGSCHFASMVVSDGLLEGDRALSRAHLLLVELLARRGDDALAELSPRGSELWEHARGALGARALAMLRAEHEVFGESRRGDEDPIVAAGLRWAPGRIPPAAAALVAGRADLLVGLFEVIDVLDGLFQIRAEISRLRDDLERGRASYPIDQLARTIGIDPRAPDAAAQILGAAATTDVVPRIARDCMERIDRGAALAERLGLHRFGDELRALDPSFREIEELFSSLASWGLPPAGAIPGGTRKRARGVGVPDVMVEKAVAIAETYLLADPHFRDAWEVHRWGLLGKPELTGRLFAPGLVHEDLAATGKDISTWVDTAFQSYRDNEHRYFDEAAPLPPDIDTLGLMLRLHRRSANPAAHAEILAAPLSWAEQAAGDDGNIPVWLLGGARGPGGVQAPLTGARCVACTTNFIRGISSFDSERFRGLIERAARYIVQRVDQVGAAASLYYPSLYFCWQLIALESALCRIPHVDVELDRLTKAITTMLRKEQRRCRTTPQDAALLTSICLDSRSRSLELELDPEWIGAIVRAQRSDGAWDGEPLYSLPGPAARSAWFSSKLATTSLCRRALWTYLHAPETR